MPLSNIFADIPGSLPEEVVQTLLTAPGIRIERIISHGQASPPGFWYEQPDNEWVLLIQGAATLSIEDDVIELRPGNYLNLPAGRKHRVEWTTPDEPTIWLAIFYH